MGQTIEVLDKTELGEILLVSADRSWSGQDGEAYAEAPVDRETFPAELAGRLFGAGLGIDHVYVMSNTVSMRRPGGWDSEAIDAAAEVISGFFRFYGDQNATEQLSSEEAPAAS
ncbi:MAG TPA: hypothetical protein VJ815_08690 [Acidimicrobiia bacterium]|nr:hypothetical protein [Acidimicrobiia bacterium]